MNRILKWAAVAVLALGAVAAVGQDATPANGARQGFRRAQHFRAMRLEALTKRLNLTDQQVARLKEVRFGERLRAFDNHTATAEARTALLQALIADAPNPAEIQQRTAALQQAQANALSEYVAALGEMNKVLTPEQRVEFRKILDEQAQRRAERREKVRTRLAAPAPAEAQP